MIAHPCHELREGESKPFVIQFLLSVFLNHENHYNATGVSSVVGTTVTRAVSSIVPTPPSGIGPSEPFVPPIAQPRISLGGDSPPVVASLLNGALNCTSNGSIAVHTALGPPPVVTLATSVPHSKPPSFQSPPHFRDGRASCGFLDFGAPFLGAKPVVSSTIEPSPTVRDVVIKANHPLSHFAAEFVPAARRFSFLQHREVSSLFRHVLSRKSLNFNDLRTQLSHRRRLDGSIISKPSALKVRELVDDKFFRPGDKPLPADELLLKPDVLALYHMLHCTDCSREGRILDECYGSTLLACASNGFNPTLLPDSDGIPKPLYHGSGVNGNHASADRFPSFVQRQIDEMLSRGAIEECFDDSMISTFNPLGVAISHSSLVQAEILTGISIVDEKSLEAAKAAASARGFSLKAKTRLVVDQTASGVNGMLAKQPFAYVSPSDVTDIMRW